MFADERKQFIDRLRRDVEQYRDNLDADEETKAKLAREAFQKDAEALRKDWENVGNSFPTR